MPTAAPLRLLLAAAAVSLLAGCVAPVVITPEGEGAPTPATVECASPQPTVYGGAAVALDSAELLGAANLPSNVCAYGSEEGDIIWIIAAPYDEGFPARMADWLAQLGWTSEELDPWGDGDLHNFEYTPPAGSEVTSAYGHAFSSYPDSVEINLGLDQEFLSHYGVEPGGELAIFAAWR